MAAHCQTSCFLNGLGKLRNGVPDDLPTTVGLAFEDDYVAAFGSNLSAVGDGG